MKILVLDEWIPLPLESGKKIRTYSLLAPLARQHQITYLCYADAQTEREKISQMADAGFATVVVPPVNRFRTPIGLAMGVATNLFLRTPLVVRKHLSRRYELALHKVLDQQSFDLVHCEWTHYASFLQKVTEIPRFLCSHNVECMSWRLFSQVQSNPIRKAAIYLEWIKMKAFEGRVVPQFDLTAVVSEDDAQIVRSWFKTDSVAVIPNGVDTRFYKETTAPMEEDLLVYCASMDAWVNQDAVTYFATRILPRIHEKRPQTRFLIMGRNPPESIRRLANDHVIVTGSVEDVRPLLAAATASVVPLRIAGGSRLKILEAFAAGIPVVSTSIGAEGLHVEPNKHLLIADDESAFAAACLDLLEDPTLRRRLATAGSTVAAEKYEWSTIVPLVENAWEQTINNFQAKMRR